VTLLLTQSRGGWLGAAAGSAVALGLRLGRPRLARWAVAVTAALVGGLLVLSAGPLADDLAARGGDRPLYWHVAWEDAAAHPIEGRGAGTFRISWLERGPPAISVQDAHSLYLETLAELGLVGLVLLAALLATPLVVALRRRGSGPLIAAAAGAYVAFLVHAGVDWDWEMPAVTVAGLLCGAALVAEKSSKCSYNPAEVIGEGAPR